MTPEVAEPQPTWAAPAAGDLPDVNVWLALAVSDHPYHGALAHIGTTPQHLGSGSAA
jgi:hypothetical protein